MPGEIAVGDFVRITGSQSMGRVSRIKGKQAEVEIGELRSSIQLQKLEKISHLPEQIIQKSSASMNLSDKMMVFSTQLDIRGQRAEEALRQLEAWLDEAILLGQTSLRVLHGKGNGILRELVRKFLRGYPQVRNIRDEHADQGGAGVTLFSWGEN